MIPYWPKDGGKPPWAPPRSATVNCTVMLFDLVLVNYANDIKSDFNDQETFIIIIDREQNVGNTVKASHIIL